jgi:hypothetical protein
LDPAKVFTILFKVLNQPFRGFMLPRDSPQNLGKSMIYPQVILYMDIAKPLPLFSSFFSNAISPTGPFHTLAKMK